LNLISGLENEIITKYGHHIPKFTRADGSTAAKCPLCPTVITMKGTSNFYRHFKNCWKNASMLRAISAWPVQIRIVESPQASASSSQTNIVV
jgi:hypothetical protein